MSVNGITNAAQTYDSKTSSKVKTNQSQKAGNSKQDAANTAAVYEKSEQAEETKKTYKPDTAAIEKLKAETDRRVENLRNLVEKMLRQQGKTFQDSTEMYSLLREGKVPVDSDTKAQAQKDIAEDGYWGVEQTSERILSFAKALSGGDKSKAEELISAVKKGYEQATKAWGGALPDICKKTMETALNKLEAWRDGKDGSSSMSDTTADTFHDQAAANKAV